VAIDAQLSREGGNIASMIERRDVDGIRILKLAHGKVSAMDIELGEAIVREMAEVTAAPIAAVIITGTGSTFSAGVDLFRVIKDGAEYGRRFLPVLEAFNRAVLTCPKPVVAAVNGHAIAGGCILAAACDHRIMVEGNGRIGIPELVVGVPFPALPLQIMAARLADGPLRDLVFTGRTVQVDEAKQLGLIDEKCPSGMLLDRAMEAAQRLAKIPSTAFALTKEAFYAPILQQTAQLADLDARVADAWMQPQTYDTIRAYLDRTIPKPNRG
jgi:enoyl-CoA hydratase